MVFLNISDGVTLNKLNTRDSQEIYNIFESEREYLEEWLPFVARMSSVNDVVKLIKYLMASKTSEVYTIRLNNKIIGMIGFLNIVREDDKLELSYWISKTMQGKGVISRSVAALLHHAFESMGINRIQLRAALNNHKSRRVPDRFNFQYEGVERAGEKGKDGSYYDIAVYSLLKDDYVDLNK